MARFIDTKSRSRHPKSITLTRPHGKVNVSITLRTNGKRVVEISDAVCAQYSTSIDALLASGEFLIAE